jgi:hypothetical protein
MARSQRRGRRPPAAAQPGAEEPEGPYKVGDTVEVLYDDAWWKAKVLKRRKISSEEAEEVWYHFVGSSST